jgi:2-amino-4-hydroxy-6-hydroxymethyldihydropteridine diphosphokinase
LTGRYVLSLGANEDDPVAALAAARKCLIDHEAITSLTQSRLWLSEPWGPIKQSWFVNQALLIDSTLQPQQLLEVTKKIEASLGRKRGVRWGPRVIDIDLVWFSGGAVDLPDLVIPHTSAHERLFVLAPWFELVPNAELAPYGAVNDLIDNLGDQICVRYQSEEPLAA